MSKQIFNGAFVALAASMLLASCSPPSQTTTINVEVPDAEAASADDERVVAAKPDVEWDETEEEQAAKAQVSEPTQSNAQDSAPASRPKSSPAKTSSSSQPQSKLLDFYDRLPSKHFVPFGGVNRRSLLKRQGVIVDYKRNYIKIPGSDNPADGDLRELQITLFPNGDEPWCAVSRVVWPQGQMPGALDFYYGYADSPDMRPRSVSEDFFPYKLRKVNGYYQSARLPRRGLDIHFSSGEESNYTGPTYRYNRKFSMNEPAFYEIRVQEEH